MRKPTLIVNAIPLYSPEPGGVSRYVKAIAYTLARLDDSFCKVWYYRKWPYRRLPTDEEIIEKPRWFFRRKVFQAGVEALHTATGGGFRTSYDLYWEPNHTFHKDIRARRRVLTVHDLSTVHHPEWHPEKRLAHFLEGFEASIREADHIVTISRYIRDEVIRHFALPEERLSVIHNGIDHAHFRRMRKPQRDRFRKARGLPEHFILSVGTLEPRKNLQSLIEAHAALPGPLAEKFPLVVAGGHGWHQEAVRKAIEAHAHMRYLGYVEDSALPLLYSTASLFVYPSRYEGFGLPPLEAMACGCPVLTSGIPPHREVLGEAAAFFDPAEAGSLETRLEGLLEDEARRTTLREAGLAHSRRYSWEEAAGRLVELFGKLL